MGELRRTMSEMKLTYFNLMGRAETTRLILAQAGVAFEDKRIEPAEWPALKASLPMGQLPILEVDGKTIGQSMTIARFCGRRFGLAGKDELEGALADQAVDQVADFLAEGEALEVSGREALCRLRTHVGRHRRLPSAHL